LEGAGRAMILILINFFKELGFRVPGVFTYSSTRMMLAALTSLIVSIFLGPFVICKLYELKIGQTIRKKDCPLLGQLHEKKENTPTMGGLLILFSMLVSLFLWMDWTHIFTAILLITTLFLGTVGARDDYLKLKYRNSKGMAGRRKLIFQVILSSLIAAYFLWPPMSEAISKNSWFKAPIVKEMIARKADETQSVQTKILSLKEFVGRLYVPFIKDPILLTGGLSVVLIAILIGLVIVGSSNATNLTDGLDGLAAGCLIMVAGAFALIAFVSNHLDIARYLNILYIEGSGEVAIYLCAMIGASLGFLWYNGYPAQIFMGDTGSLTLGGIIGVSAVLLKRELLLALVGGIFVVEALSVILQVASFRLRKKRIFLIAPLHHHFEYKGWPEMKVVMRFWIVGLLLAIIGIVSLKFQ
jgi:phospho-N-acetylmuramoyl-pentapeptide-transferase